MAESRSSQADATGPLASSGEGPWRLPRGRHGLSREIVARSQRERLIAAMVRVTAAKGYPAASVADVLEASGVGRASFYELFDGKEGCFLAAHRMLVDDLYAQMSAAQERPGAWPESVRHAIAALLEWFAADPDVARVTLVEAAGIGPGARRLFGEDLERFNSLLDEGAEFSGSRADFPNLAGIATSTIFVRIFEEVVLGQAAKLPSLLPQLTYAALLPFLGDEAARAEAAKAEAG
jgi:AcrR family transcriptional regulator